MEEEKEDFGAAYDTLRRELVELLWRQRAEGRFREANTDELRSASIAHLMQSIADILIVACPKKDSNAYAAVFADAERIANTILVHDRRDEPNRTTSAE
jgi:hypothetical protein